MEFLRAFFSRESSYFLSGGAALVGFYFGHRETNDLDLFTLEDAVESGFAIVNDVARQLGASVEAIQTAPDFRRVLFTRGDEAIIIDLIREYVFQIASKKKEIDGIRVDSPEEILVNKLCALLSRSEIRDLVDVMVLEKAGFDLESALEAAGKKDTGLSAGQLAWVLHQITFGDDLIPPGDIPASKLRLYLDGLIERLQKLALPT
ncbi:MAG: nucleotidyl transferase AbiEii/AbiGii toxin family protein [Pyrinomonadaceae bacterium]